MYLFLFYALFHSDHKKSQRIHRTLMKHIPIYPHHCDDLVKLFSFPFFSLISILLGQLSFFTGTCFIHVTEKKYKVNLPFFKIMLIATFLVLENVI